MRRITILLAVLALALPVEAATRFYLPLDDASPLGGLSSDGGWEEQDEILRRGLAHVKGADAITAGQTVDITEDQTAWQEIDRQYVSAEMNGGVVFSSGSTTVKAVVMVREFSITDNIDKCILGVRIVNSAGSIVRATLLAVAQYGVDAEFINNATMRNKQCADGDAITAGYTTVAGDRIVVEIGYEAQNINNTPQAAGKWGQNATDCAENETNTTDCAGWIEFSNTITFPGASRRVMVIQ